MVQIRNGISILNVFPNNYRELSVLSLCRLYLLLSLHFYFFLLQRYSFFRTWAKLFGTNMEYETKKSVLPKFSYNGFADVPVLQLTDCARNRG